MRHATDAGYRAGNRKGCMKGTRRNILLQLENWLNDEQDKRVFWLNGLTGTGKSTIAQTFAEISFANGILGASFFCSRYYEDTSVTLQRTYLGFVTFLNLYVLYSQSKDRKKSGLILMACVATRREDVKMLLRMRDDR